MQHTEVIVRHDNSELARVALVPGEYIIGRSREAHIHAETPLISRQHARLTIQDSAVLIEDLGSSNGTFVDGEPIAERTWLLSGQSLRLGDVEVEIVRPQLPVEAEPVVATPIEQLLPDEMLAQQRYAIGQQVARGGMGAILQAEQAAMKRRVAMKIMLEHCDADDVLRFVEEAQITGQLEHPNIVPIYELGLDEQRQLFYTMKFVRGITLKKVLELIAQGVPETMKKFPLPALLTIFQKTCDAIAFAHSRGVVHRDLKPENIMLGDFGEVLVMDWGLAKLLGSVSRTPTRALRSGVYSARQHSGGSSHTMAGTILGTPQYMAPEQARGEVDALDVRADISPLAGMTTLKVLRLSTCPIQDFTPLKGLPLTELRVGSSSFSDLSLLEGMPLALLTIDNCGVTDVAPLARMTSLRMLVIPRGAKNIDALRKLPHLTHLSYTFNIDREMPDRLAADFWVEYDAAQKAAPK